MCFLGLFGHMGFTEFRVLGLHPQQFSPNPSWAFKEWRVPKRRRNKSRLLGDLAHPEPCTFITSP